MTRECVHQKINKEISFGKPKLVSLAVINIKYNSQFIKCKNTKIYSQ